MLINITERYDKANDWYIMSIWTREHYLIDITEIVNWCRDTFGPTDSNRWDSGHINFGVIKIKRGADATLFKLRWHGADEKLML